MSRLFNKKRARQRGSKTASNSRQQYNDYYRSQTSDTMSNVVRPESSKRKTFVNRRQASMHAKRLPIYIASLAIVAALLFASLLQSTPTMLFDEGKSLYNKQHYVKSASDLLSSNFYNKSKLSFDSVAFKNDFLLKHPEVNDITVAVPLTGRKLTIGLSFVPAVFLFTSANGNKVVVGSNGIVQANASDVESSKLASLLPVNDSAPIRSDIGSAVLLPSDVSFITSVITDLKQANIEVGTVTLPLGAGEVHITPKDSTMVIKFSLSGDAKQQTGAYLAIVKQPNIIGPQTQYVDVRLADRVFVK